MIAVDTSAAVAALAAWHPGMSRRAGRRPRRSFLPTLVSRPPACSRGCRPPPTRFSARGAPARALVSAGVVGRCRDAQVQGGAVYDALVGLTAAEASLTPLTRDARAARTYPWIGVAFDLVH